MNEKQLKEAAVDLNELIKPKPPINFDAGMEQLSAEVKEVGMMLEGGDEIILTTAEVLKELGCVIPEDVKIKKSEDSKKESPKATEEKPVAKVEKEEVKAKKVVEVKKVAEAKSVKQEATKVVKKEEKMAKKSKAVKKVKAEKVAPAAKKVAKGNGKGKTWKEGSTASLILAAVTSKPLADKEIFAAVKKDLAKKSDNPIARVKRVLAVSAQRALIIKTEDGKYKTK